MCGKFTCMYVYNHLNMRAYKSAQIFADLLRNLSKQPLCTIGDYLSSGFFNYFIAIIIKRI